MKLAMHMVNIQNNDYHIFIEYVLPAPLCPVVLDTAIIPFSS